MNRNGALRLRRDFTHEVALEMVRMDHLIQRAIAEHHWAEAAELEDVRESLMYARMTILRRDWQGPKSVAG